MLVLTRNVGERIVIDTPLGQIKIELIDMRGSKARIGVEAPRAIAVHREEVHKRIGELLAAGN